MARGKETCRILKEIRRNVAEANGIEFVTEECRYKGDCLGTCPKCEAEVRYLEQQLRARSLAGKAVALAGISAASLAMFAPMSSQARITVNTEDTHAVNVAVADVDAAKLKGRVTDGDSINAEVLIGASVKNLANGKMTLADVDGKFEIDASQGDSIQVSFVGYETKTICVTDVSKPVTVALEWDETAILGEPVVVGGARAATVTTDSILDLIFTDEKGNPISADDIEIYKLFIDEDGEEDDTSLSPYYIGEDTGLRLIWDADYDLRDDDGNPLKEVKLRIEAEGYQDKIVKVKHPKRHTTKTIKLKHNKK